MERQSSTFEYLCRVCAANTKGKNSVPECVYILKTPGLKDKIEKFLYLTISEDDILPKVLCKTCFRQVEATASLSKIAKHTQKVFRDFIFNTKSCLQAESNDSSTATTSTTTAIAPPPPPPPPPPPATTTTSYAPPAPQAVTVRPSRTREREKEKEKARVISPELPPPKSNIVPSSKCTHSDEVILNVSVNDPLTRETQHKMINASRNRKNSIDTRYAPKSIAQRGITTSVAKPPTAAEVMTPTKKQYTPGVINFFPNRPEQVTTVTSGGYVIGSATNTTPAHTASNNVVNDPPTIAAATTTTTLQQKRRNLRTALNNSKPSNAGQVSLLKNAQKSTATTEKSSQPPPKTVDVEPDILLVEDNVPAEPLPEKMIIAAAKQQKNHVQSTTPPDSSPPSELELLETEPPQTEPTDLSQAMRTSIPDDILLGKVIKDGDLLKLILKALKWPVNRRTEENQLNRLRNSRFAHIMADPNLLKDADLTQIMGPYLGPVLQAAHMLQQQQIAAAAAAAAVAKETDLQVTSIATALPYKLPAETSVQLVPASPEAGEETPDGTTDAQTSASSHSLKRNADKEGAVQTSETVPAADPPKKRPRRTTTAASAATTRARRASVFTTNNNNNNNSNSNDNYAALSSALNSQYLNTKSNSDLHIDPLDPAALFAQLSMLSGLSAASSNEALLALLQRQRVALARLQQQQMQTQAQTAVQSNLQSRSRSRARSRRQRSNSIITVPASGSDFVFDTDDIILMEPDDFTETTTTTNSQNNQNDGSNNEPASTSTISQSENNMVFQVPQQVPKPIITRPIIKRRKTVIQASPACMNLAINAQEVTSTSVPPAKPAENVDTTTSATTPKLITSVTTLYPTTTAVAAPQRKLSKTQSLDSMNVIATQYPSNIISIGTQIPSTTSNASEAPITGNISTKATETTLAVTASAATSVTSLVASNVGSTAERSTTRSAGSKRQPLNKLSLGQQLLEAIGLQKGAAEATNAPVVAAAIPPVTSGTRGSIQQIRSALKKSLQKAQEQQQQRNRKGTTHTVDEQDDRDDRTVNIVREVVVQPRKGHAANTPVGELDVEEEINKITLVLQSKSKDDKNIEEADKHMTAAAPTKIPGIRRKMMPPTRNRKSAIVLVADEIVDLVDDEDNQEDSAAGRETEKNKDKEASSLITEKGDQNVYAKGESKTTTKYLSPTRRRAQNLKPEEVAEILDDSDEEDNLPLKPRTVKTTNDKQTDQSPTRSVTPRQRSRPSPANGRKVPSERDYEKESDDGGSVKNDNESTTSTMGSTRPSRVSKTLSKYYKGPADISPSTPRRSTVSTRSGRVRS